MSHASLLAPPVATSSVVGAQEGRADGSTPPATVGAGAEQTSCVVDVHDVVAHGWPETYAEGLTSLAPKPKPRMVTAAPREAGAFSGEKPVAKVAATVGCVEKPQCVCVCVRVCVRASAWCIDIHIGVDTFT